MFLPFAFGSTTLITNYLWTADYSGPFLSPSYRTYTFYWSFLYVEETKPAFLFPPSMSLPPDPVLVRTRVGFLPEIWGWNTPLLHSIFPLQIVLLALGFYMVKNPQNPLRVATLFLGWLIGLLIVSYFTATSTLGTLSFGFWALILATLFASIALARAKKWAKLTSLWT